VFFAGGGFSPGRLPDVLGQARTSLGGSPQLVHYLAVPPVAFGTLTQALGQRDIKPFTKHSLRQHPFRAKCHIHLLAGTYGMVRMRRGGRLRSNSRDPRPCAEGGEGLDRGLPGELAAMLARDVQVGEAA